jgi:hypothetical protein
MYALSCDDILGDSRGGGRLDGKVTRGSGRTRQADSDNTTIEQRRNNMAKIGEQVTVTAGSAIQSRVMRTKMEGGGRRQNGEREK